MREVAAAAKSNGKPEATATDCSRAPLFVIAQLRAELPVTVTRPRLYHVRQQQGRFEVKATASPGPADARHLAGLRDRYPDTFVAGVVLHTGPRAYGLGERLMAVPISVLWTS